MRYRIAPLLAALVLLVACGGDDTSRGNTLDDDETTTTTAAGDESTATTAVADDEPISTRQILARLVIQVDDAFRAANAVSRPCIVGPREQCAGEVLEAYERLDELAGGLRFVLDGATNPADQMYSGRAADDAVALIETSLYRSDDAEAKAEAAQAACLPQPGAGCDDASAALDAAIVELLKDMNDWRHLL